MGVEGECPVAASQLEGRVVDDPLEVDEVGVLHSFVLESLAHTDQVHGLSRDVVHVLEGELVPIAVDVGGDHVDVAAAEGVNGLPVDHVEVLRGRLVEIPKERERTRNVV